MKSILKNIYYLFLPIILGSLIGIIIAPSINYQSLTKPPLAPGKLAFPIMWSIIYLLMGITYYLFKKKARFNTEWETKIYYIQLIVNLLWSIIFFTFKWYFIAVIWIILLDGLVLYMIYLFSKKVKVAAYLK